MSTPELWPAAQNQSALGFEMGECSPSNFSNTSNPDIEILQFYAYGVISPVIIGFGIFGDLMTIFVLTHPLLRRSSIIYSYLTALAATDLLTLLSLVPMVLLLVGVKSCSPVAAVYYAHVGFPLANALMAASVWIVTALTLAQYVAICHPFIRRFRSRTLAAGLTGIAYAISLLIHVPWAFRKSVRAQSDECPFVACDNGLAHSEWYTAYSVGRELVSRILPFLLLSYFNVCILVTYRETKKDRMKRVSQTQRGMLEQKGEREERRMWKLLLGIVSVFFVCTIPASPFTIAVNDQLDDNFPFQLFRAITNVLEFTKFALNFYFYCMVNPDIRSLAIKRLTCQEIIKPAMQGNNVQLSSLVNGNGRASASSAGKKLSRCSDETPWSKRSQSLPPSASRSTSLLLAARRQSRRDADQVHRPPPPFPRRRRQVQGSPPSAPRETSALLQPPVSSREFLLEEPEREHLV